MLTNIIEISDKNFCINFGELDSCINCTGFNTACIFFESFTSRFLELENLNYNKKV